MVELNIDKVVRIHSGEGTSCPTCKTLLDGHGDWAGAVNHVLGHGWKLLHVGGEWGEDRDGKTIQFTVAVLGRP